MLRKTPVLIIAAALLTMAAPAFGKASMQDGQSSCKAAFAAQTPTPSSVRLIGAETKVTPDTLLFVFKVKAEDKQVGFKCSVDRETNVATLTPTSG